MRKYIRHAAHICVALLFAVPCTVSAQMETDHRMWSTGVGGGWTATAMAQLYPVVTFAAPGGPESLQRTAFYLTQPALMMNLESPGSALVLRTTLNFEGVTQTDGEVTPGGWGEGFIDSRHPHTFLHEAMLSVNWFDVAGAAASISAGRGFAPYGTDDPMSRPVLKYPTNHHLSQILERWTLNGVVAWPGASIEAGLFAGAEPTGPWDFDNFDGFGDSWSVRATKRFAAAAGTAIEASASLASVTETHHDEETSTGLWNVALRYGGAHVMGRTYALVEYSASNPEEGSGDFSLLGEARLERGRHAPYARVEHATRPEYTREGLAGTDEFFRYDHDAHAIGSTRWTIVSAGYAWQGTVGTLAVHPFVEGQWHQVSREEGPLTLEPNALFGDDSFGALSLGFRLHFGGSSMRMGTYGVLDAMTGMRRAMHGGGDAMHHGH